MYHFFPQRVETENFSEICYWIVRSFKTSQFELRRDNCPPVLIYAPHKQPVVVKTRLKVKRDCKGALSKVLQRPKCSKLNMNFIHVLSEKKTTTANYLQTRDKIGGQIAIHGQVQCGHPTGNSALVQFMNSSRQFVPDVDSAFMFSLHNSASTKAFVVGHNFWYWCQENSQLGIRDLGTVGPEPSFFENTKIIHMYLFICHLLGSNDLGQGCSGDL